MISLYFSHSLLSTAFSLFISLIVAASEITSEISPLTGLSERMNIVYQISFIVSYSLPLSSFQLQRVSLSLLFFEVSIVVIYYFTFSSFSSIFSSIDFFFIDRLARRLLIFAVLAEVFRRIFSEYFFISLLLLSIFFRFRQIPRSLLLRSDDTPGVCIFSSSRYFFCRLRREGFHIFSAL